MNKQVKTTLNYIYWALVHPMSWLFSCALGFVIGKYYPPLIHALSPIAGIFNAFLNMCIIPILVTAIATSFAKLISISSVKVSKITLITMAICLILSSLLGYLFTMALITHEDFKGEINNDFFRETIVETSQVERTMDQPIEKSLEKGLERIIKLSIPQNIFKALVEDQAIKIVIFSILIGLAIPFIKPRLRNNLLQALEGIQQTFLIIFKVVILLFPIAAIVLFGQSARHAEQAELMAIGNYIFNFYGAGLVLFIIACLILRYYLHTPFVKLFRYFREPFLVAGITGSDFAAIPGSIEIFTKKYNLDRTIANIIIPLGIITCRFGNIFYFAFTSVFIIKFYGASITFNEHIFIISMAIFIGMATTGLEQNFDINLLTLILFQLDLPLGVLSSFLNIVDPVIAPGRSILTISMNSAAVAIIRSYHRRRLKRAP